MYRLPNYLLLAAVMSFMALQSQAQAQQSFDKEKLDTYLNVLHQENKFMGAVAIDSAGNRMYANALGYANINEPEQKATMETKYRIGSVTKTFTAVMIFQLIEEGKLSLGDKLAKFYPKLPKADSITVGNLLSHRSGLFNFTNAPNYTDWMTEARSQEQMLELISNGQSQFSPGTQTSYSNTNYVLLGYIIEDITGESYATQLQKRITKPLNLNNTYYGAGIDVAKGEAASFRYTDSTWSKLPETDMSIPGGAGAMVSTPGDLLTFIRALFKGNLVAKESLKKMKDIDQGIGMGLLQIPFYDTFAYGHNGGIDGFQAHLSYFPDQDVAFAFTANGLDYNMNNILIGILSIYFGKDFTIPSFDAPTITLSSQQMQAFVGNYASSQLPIDIEVFIKDQTLMAQATGQPAIPLTATNETTVRFEQAGLVMKFDSLQSKKYQQFTLEQGGGSFIFKRQ